jgi:CRP-like cAMP-binding protein
MDSPIAQELAPHETIQVWSEGKMLFREGGIAKGVWFLHSGEVELQFSRRTLMCAEAGQLLALTSVMANRAHDCTATTRTPCVTGFIEAKRFRALLDEKPELFLAVLRMISANIGAWWEYRRSLNDPR